MCSSLPVVPDMYGVLDKTTATSGCPMRIGVSEVFRSAGWRRHMLDRLIRLTQARVVAALAVVWCAHFCAAIECAILLILASWCARRRLWRPLSSIASMPGIAEKCLDVGDYRLVYEAMQMRCVVSAGWMLGLRVGGCLCRSRSYF